MSTPPSQTGATMGRDEVEAFLTSQDTGVLSLGVENRGYGFPISYTFHDDADRLVVGFVSSPASKKREFAESAQEATFTVYDYADVDAWRSVIATGPIHAIDVEDVSYSVPDLFFRPEDGDAEMVDLDEFERAWYELEIDELAGRQSGM